MKKMHKKGGNTYLYFLFTGMFLVLLFLAGYMTNWFGMGEPTGVSPDYTPIDKTGDLGSLKYSLRTISNPSAIQFAGTGYCWDITDPDVLLESSSGKTTSATAGTSFSNTFRGSTYECTGFSSSHYCDHAVGIMGKEGLNLRSDCYNLTANQVKITFYENDAAESSNSLTIPAGSAKYYNKFMFEVNNSYVSYPLKALCFATNTTSSHLQMMDVKGWDLDANPSSSYDYCFSLKEPKVLVSDQFLFNNHISFTADSTGFGTHELITVTMMDACEYVSDQGRVKEDYFARDTSSRSDCGTSNPTTTIKLIT